MWKFNHTMLTSEVMNEAERMYQDITITAEQRQQIERAAYVACMNKDTTAARLEDFARVLKNHHVSPEDIAPAAEAEQQPTETAEAAQAAPAARQADDITAAIIGAIGAPAPAHTVTVSWANGTRATYSAAMLDMLRTDPAALDIQDDTTGEIVYIKPDTDTEEKEEDNTMSNPNKLYLSNWDYNAALIIEELAAIVENNGGTVKPGTETIIENRALNENMRKAADRLAQLESIEADNPGTNEHRTDAIKRLRADIEKWERIDNTPRTVHHCTWSSAYISFKLGGMYYYYQTDRNPFFDFYYQKTPIDVNGTVSRCACLENDPKEWLYDCFFRAEATDADRREAANLIYNMLVKAAPSVIRRDSHRVRVRNQYDGRYHYETVYEKERREAVNF
jgi:hypothetical protein